MEVKFRSQMYLCPIIASFVVLCFEMVKIKDCYGKENQIRGGLGLSCTSCFMIFKKLIIFLYFFIMFYVLISKIIFEKKLF